MAPKRIEIKQENYAEILEIARESSSRTDLLKNIGWEKNMNKLDYLDNLLKQNNFNFSSFRKIKKQQIIKEYTKEILTEYVKQSYSYANIFRLLGKAKSKESYSILKRYIEKYQIDTSHFGSKHKYLNPEFSIERTNEEIFIENSPVETGVAKKRILRDALIPYECHGPGCLVETKWLGSTIVLHLEHINGNNRDHRLSNLIFLCPNCHSITPTYCGRNNKNRPGKSSEPAFNRKLELDKDNLLNNILPKCNTVAEVWKSYGLGEQSNSHAGLKGLLEGNLSHPNVLPFIKRSEVKKPGYPPVEKLLSEVKEKGFEQVGRELNCSGNSIRKHLKSKGIDVDKEIPKNNEAQFMINFDLEDFLNKVLLAYKSLSEITRHYELGESGRIDYNNMFKRLFEKNKAHKNVQEFLERSKPRKIAYPPILEVIKRIKESSIRKVAKEIGCDHVSLRTYLLKHNIEPKTLSAKKNEKN